jgi:hypothetical protein
MGHRRSSGSRQFVFTLRDRRALVRVLCRSINAMKKFHGGRLPSGRCVNRFSIAFIPFRQIATCSVGVMIVTRNELVHELN